MIRRAVGAIAMSGNEYILVHKVKGISPKVDGVWDFPKGGVEPYDASLADAILRELLEETGSDKFIIVKEFEEKISFSFGSLASQIGFGSQETTMFLCEYIGNKTDLQPQDNEIDAIRFVNLFDVMSVLTHEETKVFVKKHLLN